MGEEEEYCKDCQSHPKAFDQGRGIFLYDKQMKQSIMKFKYYGCREYGRFLCQSYVHICRNGNEKMEARCAGPCSDVLEKEENERI